MSKEMPTVAEMDSIQPLVVEIGNEMMTYFTALLRKHAAELDKHPTAAGFLGMCNAAMYPLTAWAMMTSTDKEEMGNMLREIYVHVASRNEISTVRKQ